MDKDFWKKKKLKEMNRQEWEALCDGCSLCCLEKLEDVDTGEIFYSNSSCRHLDEANCRCLVYDNRYEKAPECFELTPDNIKEIKWLPYTCAYRLIHEGKDLFGWHHLVSGSLESVHEAGISVKGR